ncbi:zinc finger protein castor homolog 1 isoform X4 [Chiloscyllium plagiosum]|uniref:zinc finger protein castor homolog 1 isoform X4 n=1 Tax=Chiloscyllium plagiosum TaxID=36176 RepID=UPI001CB8250E|nr:zinc finger protein castor homolog 1 isoform X4 [Chiloscyllium plagiosum]
MAAKRKGGLKLNAICAKLSRQVDYNFEAEQTEPDHKPQENNSADGLRHGDQEGDTDTPDGLHDIQKLEEDKKRREAIEKWVNGEYMDEHGERGEERLIKAGDSAYIAPEGVYMVQPKGCSDEEDNDGAQGSLDGSYMDDRDSEEVGLKEEGYNSSSEASIRQASIASSGETSTLHDYAATTMNEFLGMFGYDDQNVRDELAKKISFDKLNATTSETYPAASPGEDSLARRVRISKYEEYIRKLKAGEHLPRLLPLPKAEDSSSRTLGGKDPNPAGGPFSGQEAPVRHDAKPTAPAAPPSSSAHGLLSRASKYDYFIQKLKIGESIRPQNGNSYKRPSKYDLENVKYLHLFKPGEGDPDMGGAIAFKTGKVGRPSKYDIKNIQKLAMAKAPTNPGIAPLSSSPCALTVSTESPTSASFGSTDLLKSSFSKTDSITTGTVSTVNRLSKTETSLDDSAGRLPSSAAVNRNGLSSEKPGAITDDANIYQKYIARFSGSQQCGHIHCAYQYREHYHCLDPECNYQRFTSKQDVIRHYNMHKKRDNSLQHGFMRFSPLDDCSVYYHGCHLNGKSTHYHCMQVGCTKVYTSTSDVMTHENFHKKNAQLINDGFQRFRATEDCGTLGCQFYGQKTTHFHCRRPGCTFTFKNKCDIEKHKSYHIKDDAYAKDGFKKFYKYEECKYEGCVYSKATNHFHCIRVGCGFTFTSTSQMTSHKRKHERRHIRNTGGPGLASQLLGRKENEQDDSSNDDLIDYSAISSKNSSLSASPTSQQSAGPILLPTPTTEISSSQAARPTSNLIPATKMSTILPQTLASPIPVALALSNASLSNTGPFFPIIPNRVSMAIPVTAANLISAISSSVPTVPTESPSQVVSGSSNTIPLSPAAATTIMEKITASKGLISPMMARLAAAALKPSNPADLAGNEQQTQLNQFSLVPVKQEPSDITKTQSQDSTQNQSLDLSLKEHSTESNGHVDSGQTSLLSSFLNKMSQNSSGLSNLLNLKTEPDCAQSDAEQMPYMNKALTPQRQEKRQEFWEKYLRRFTTEDYCESQCDFLHKTHFHCAVEDCGALFSTLDGAVKHANFHFRSDGGTVKVKSEPSLPTTIPVEIRGSGSGSGSGCSSGAGAGAGAFSPVAMVTAAAMLASSAGPAVVTAAPTLLAWKQLAASMPQLPASTLATSPLATTSLENAKPQVKPGFLQFQENDPCLATDCKYANKFHFHCLFGNCKYVCKTSGKAESHCLDHINPNNNLINVRDQFSYYSLQCLCPNQQCEFRMRGHYHCLRPFCNFVTNITTKLPWHIKKHEKAERRAANGFKYFTKREECSRLGKNSTISKKKCFKSCKYNQVNSHFHCIREGCHFSFLLKHQMTSHSRKHMRRMLGKNFDKIPNQGPRCDDALGNVAAATGSSAMSSTPNMMDTETDEYMDYPAGTSPAGLSSESSVPDRSGTSTPIGNESSATGCPVATAADAVHTAPSPSFPPALLTSPAPPPSLSFLLPPSCLSLLSTNLGTTRNVVIPTSTPGFSPIIAAPSPIKSDVPIVQDAAGNTISLPTASGAKKRFWIIEDMSPFGKRRKTASSRKMLDEGMMLEGFKRYDLYEDCKDTSCQFSLKVTHYHCTRENCGYKFCGRTHMYKHAQHHDRVDNLVLDDFKRFKSSLRCYFADCQFSGNSTHFHCLRCGFRCTDSTKVTAHRKHHGKQDVISAAGFCQFSSSVDCGVPDCKYKLKCSHFHCTYPECKHTVVGMSQMDSHKRKHEKLERGETTSVSPPREAMHAMGTTTEYDSQGSSLNLDGSLNLSTNVDSSLFFLRNPAGIGLNDSLDLSTKPHEVVSVAGPLQEDPAVTSGDAEDENDMTQDEDLNEDDDDLNTDSDSSRGTVPENTDEKDDATGL